MLAFDALVLSEALGRKVDLGKIIHGDDRVALKVKTDPLDSDLRKITAKIATLLSGQAPPDLVLNRHCAECEFQKQCRQKAVDEDWYPGSPGRQSFLRRPRTGNPHLLPPQVFRRSGEHPISQSWR